MPEKAEIHLLDKAGNVATKKIKVMFNPTKYTFSESAQLESKENGQDSLESESWDLESKRMTSRLRSFLTLTKPRKMLEIKQRKLQTYLYRLLREKKQNVLIFVCLPGGNLLTRVSSPRWTNHLSCSMIRVFLCGQKLQLSLSPMNQMKKLKIRATSMSVGNFGQ